MSSEYGFGKITTNGLVLCMDPGDKNSYSGTGTLLSDLSGKRNNGTLVNGPVYSSQNGGILSFDGVNDTVLIPVSTSLQSTFFTYDIWFKLNTTGTHLLFSSHVQDSGNQVRSGLAVVVYLNQYWFQTRLNNVCCQNLLVGTVSSNKWINFSGTWNGTIKTAYLNGSEAGTQSVTGTHSQVNNFYIGNDADRIAWTNNYGNSPLNGFIGSVRYYNRALTASEILRNYNKQKSRFGY
jgi:hypothetical protein